jgi:CrcB protein
MEANPSILDRGKSTRSFFSFVTILSFPPRHRSLVMADDSKEQARPDSPTPSHRESESSSQRASHGSASTNRPKSQTSLHTPAFNLNAASEIAAPPPIITFFDEGTIRRQTSLEEYRQRKKAGDARATWPLREHHMSGANTKRHGQVLSQTDEDILPDDFDINEIIAPLAIENWDEHGISNPTTPVDLTYASPKVPTRERSEGDLIQARKSSKRGSRTRQRKSKRASQHEKQRISQIPNAAEGPGSRSKEDATALPQTFPYNVDNLEEQLAAAQQLSFTSSDLSRRREWVSRFATELYTISYLIFFSILGTLARLGLQWLTFYPGAPVVISVLWANFAGSFFIGFLSEDRRVFREEWGSHSASAPSLTVGEKRAREEESPDAIAAHGKVKKTIPLYIGLATGFCGSLTSFSSFMRDVFLSLSNNLPTPINHSYPQDFIIPSTTSTIHRSGGFSFLALVGIIILTLCLCLAVLKVGIHLAVAVDPWMPTLPFTFLRKIVDPLAVFLGFGCWLGAVFMSIWPPDRHSTTGETWRGQAVFACVFAPVGCLARFYVSLCLNRLSASFPLGTFAVNIFGTAVEGMAYDLQHLRFASEVGGGLIGCQILQGVMDGFCGCLTTVSTWVLELNGLKRAHGYFYGAASVVSGLSLLVLIMGTVRWTVGFDEITCTA